MKLNCCYIQIDKESKTKVHPIACWLIYLHNIFLKLKNIPFLFDVMNSYEDA